MLWNVNGLKSKLSNPDLITFFSKFDIICLTETWGTKSDNFQLPGYISYSKIRVKRCITGRNSGGVLAFIKSKYSQSVMQLNGKSEDILWLKFDTSHVILIVCIVYFSPQSSSSYSNEFLFDLLEDEHAHFLQSFPEYHFIITGDFNARTASEPDYLAYESMHVIGTDTDFDQNDIIPTRQSRDSEVNYYGKCLLEMCKASGLRIVNGRKSPQSSFNTCINERGSSVVDYVLCNTHTLERISRCVVGDRVESDHQPLYLTFNYMQSVYTMNTLPHCTAHTNPPRLIWNDVGSEKFYKFWDTQQANQSIADCVYQLENDKIDESIESIIKILYGAA